MKGLMPAPLWLSCSVMCPLLMAYYLDNSPKERVGTISHQERRAALTMFEKFRGLRLELVEIEAADFEAAAKLCDASGAPSRAGDALHLAVCRRVRGSLATMDKGLAAAGQEVGLAVELIQA
jgi:predicted nucleic acid-binding protein